MADRTAYAEIADHYRKKIVDGELRPGDRLPSMRDVREEFNVSMATVNRAFRLLKDEGLTTVDPGNATVVANRSKVVTTGVARLDRLSRTGRQYAHGETSTDHVSIMLSCDDPEICQELDIEPRDEILLRRRTFRGADGRPTAVGSSFIHARAIGDVPELLQQGQLRPFWQETYRTRTGREVFRSPERRTARFASKSELAALELPILASEPVPVLVTRSTFHDEQGPIEVWEDVYAPGTWQVASE